MPEDVGIAFLCAFGQEANTLVILCADGSYFKFAIDLKTGEYSKLAVNDFLNLVS